MLTEEQIRAMNKAELCDTVMSLQHSRDNQMRQKVEYKEHLELVDNELRKLKAVADTRKTEIASLDHAHEKEKKAYQQQLSECARLAADNDKLVCDLQAIKTVVNAITDARGI